MINTDIGPMVIGGQGYSQSETFPGNRQSSMYYLASQNGDDNWTLFNQSLKIPRNRHMVIPIDDSYAEKIHKTYQPQDIDISTSPVSKFLVIGGYPRNMSKNVEFIDLKRPDARCEIPDLPRGLVRPTGAFAPKYGPVICTGWDPIPNAYLNFCYVLSQEGKFEELDEELCESVNERWDAVSVVTTHGNLWILGGGGYANELFPGNFPVPGTSVQTLNSWNEGLASTQLIQLGGGLGVHTTPERLPKGLLSACLAKINDTTAIFTGGTQKRSASPVTEDSTYYLNLVNLTISSGPKMNQSRYDHGCGTFQSSDKTVTIVAGGHIDERTLLSSTEYLMDNEWHEGEFLRL